MSDEQDPRGAGSPPPGGAHRAAARRAGRWVRPPGRRRRRVRPTRRAAERTPLPRPPSRRRSAPCSAAPRAARSFAPAPGERLGPRPTETSAVPPMFADAFGRPPRNREGFDPAPGTRMPPTGPPPESPWWKPGAARDPWRDPGSPYWLGRGAIFAQGRLAQLDPDQDTESDLSDATAADADEGEDEDLDTPSNVRRVKFGLPTIVAHAGDRAGRRADRRRRRLVADPAHRRCPAPLGRIDREGRDRRCRDHPRSVADIAKRVGPAVVSIAVHRRRTSSGSAPAS